MQWTRAMLLGHRKRTPSFSLRLNSKLSLISIRSVIESTFVTFTVDNWTMPQKSVPIMLNWTLFASDMPNSNQSRSVLNTFASRGHLPKVRHMQDTSLSVSDDWPSPERTGIKVFSLLFAPFKGFNCDTCPISLGPPSNDRHWAFCPSNFSTIYGPLNWGYNFEPFLYVCQPPWQILQV